MTVRTVLLTVVLTGMCFSPAWAGLPAEGVDAGTIASDEKAIADAKDEKEAALLRKKLGDYYASQEDYKKAAEEFVKALSLSPSPFTRQERLQMAIAISWADRLDDAIRVLQALLAEDQQDRDARIHLAKVLSWSDRLQEAEAEADIVLKDYPENQDALLVKANTLRWRGEAAASIPVYEKALAQGENFDVRIGLASAYLAIGKKETAKETGSTLKPSFPYQVKELKKFQDALCATRPAGPGIQYSYYKDSDDNRENRYALFFGFWVHDWESEVRYDLFDAVDPVRKEKAEDVLFRTYSRHGTIGTGAGLGVIRTDSRSGNTVIGHLKADVDLGWGTVGVSAAREVLTDTAQLIENEIVRSSEALFLSQRTTERLSFFESYIRSDYSDGNGANDVRFAFKYTAATRGPKIDTGYRFRYLDFRRQSGSGYFDPEDFTVHQVFLSLYDEHQGFYVFFEPYVGYQSFTRYGAGNSETIAGASATAGWNMKRCTSFEINAEGGNNAGATAAGFKYYLIGFRLNLFI